MASQSVNDYRLSLRDHYDTSDSDTSDYSSSEDERYEPPPRGKQTNSKVPKSPNIYPPIEKTSKQVRGIGAEASAQETRKKRNKNNSDSESDTTSNNTMTTTPSKRSSQRPSNSVEQLLMKGVIHELNKKYPDEGEIEGRNQIEISTTGTIKLPVSFEFSSSDVRQFDKGAGKAQISTKTLKYLAACAVLQDFKNKKKLIVKPGVSLVDHAASLESSLLSRMNRIQFIIQEITDISVGHDFPHCNLVFTMDSLTQPVLSSRYTNGVVIPPTHGQIVPTNQKLSFGVPWSQYKSKLDEYGVFSRDNIRYMITDSDKPPTAIFRALWVNSPLGALAIRNEEEIGVSASLLMDKSKRWMDGDTFRMTIPSSDRLITKAREGYEQLNIPTSFKCKIKRADGMSFEDGMKKWLSGDSHNDIHFKTDSFNGDFSASFIGCATIVVIMDE